MVPKNIRKCFGLFLAAIFPEVPHSIQKVIDFALMPSALGAPGDFKSRRGGNPRGGIHKTPRYPQGIPKRTRICQISVEFSLDVANRQQVHDFIRSLEETQISGVPLFKMLGCELVSGGSPPNEKGWYKTKVLYQPLIVCGFRFLQRRSCGRLRQQPSPRRVQHCGRVHSE